MEQIQACAILRISLPIDEAGLKSAFRRRSHETHPDRGGTSDAFIAVNKAYELLKSLVGSSLIFVHETTGTTVTGETLSELGKGFPITESAKPCESCRGAGYITLTVSGGDCKACMGQGTYTRITRHCDCISQWPIRRCYRCNGTGSYIWLQLKRPFRCVPCDGTGFSSKVARHRHALCRTCQGIGEVRMWNPVIPRGRLG